jgi:hypothetical protein
MFVIVFAGVIFVAMLFMLLTFASKRRRNQ